MTYEEENRKLKEQLANINKEIRELESYISQYDHSFYYSSRDIFNPHKSIYNYHAFACNDAKKKLTILTIEKKYIEETLKESPKRRMISNIVKKIPDGPQKVYDGGFFTKPMYSISDGCLIWLLVFSAIGTLIIAIALG